MQGTVTGSGYMEMNETQSLHTTGKGLKIKDNNGAILYKRSKERKVYIFQVNMQEVRMLEQV